MASLAVYLMDLNQISTLEDKYKHFQTFFEKEKSNCKVFNITFYTTLYHAQHNVCNIA